MQIISSLTEKKEQTKQEKSSAKREALRTKISAYADLPDDFDGDDGHAPAQQDIENALSFIPLIPEAGLSTVRAMVAGDGDVGFDWEQEPRLEVGFTDGEISFFGDMPDGEILGEDAVYDKNALPEKLQRLMSALFPS